MCRKKGGSAEDSVDRIIALVSGKAKSQAPQLNLGASLSVVCVLDGGEVTKQDAGPGRRILDHRPKRVKFKVSMLHVARTDNATGGQPASLVRSQKGGSWHRRWSSECPVADYVDDPGTQKKKGSHDKRVLCCAGSASAPTLHCIR